MNNDYANDMLELKNPFLCYDEAFWKVFYDLDNIIVKMFCDITGVSYEKLKNNTILLRNNQSVSKDNTNAKKYDYVLRFCDSHILILELNKNSINWNIYSQIYEVLNIFDKKYEKSLCFKHDKLLQVDLNVYKDKAYDNSSPIEFKRLIAKCDDTLYVDTACLYDVSVPKCYEEYIKKDNLDNVSNALKWGALLYCEDIQEIDRILTSLLIDENDKKIILDRFSKLDKNLLSITEGERADIYQKHKIECMVDDIIKKDNNKEDNGNDTNVNND